MHKNATGHPTGSAPPHSAKTVRHTGSRLRDVLQKAIDILLLWRERSRQRCALAKLSDDLLKDIGISRLEARGESTKRPWRE